MSDRGSADVLSKIFTPGTGPHYDQIVDIATGGRDRLWKQELLGRLEQPRRVLDLACGTGILTFMLRERFPDVEVVGVDLNPEYLDIARQRAVELGDSKVNFLLTSAEDLALTSTFDVIVSCYLPKYADLAQLIPRLVRRLHDGGLMIMQDFVYPDDPVVARAWRWAFQKNRDWARQNLPQAVSMFEVLPEVIRESNWVEELVLAMREQNLEGISRKVLDHGLAMVWGFKKLPGEKPA